MTIKSAIVTSAIILFAYPQIFGQEKLQSRLIEISKQIGIDAPNALIEGREVAMDGIRIYGDDSEYYGVWAWLTYFNSEIVIRHQKDKKANIEGLKDKEAELLREGEDALNKAYILAQSDNEFYWKNPWQTAEGILSKAGQTLIAAKRNSIVIYLSETDDFSAVQNAHGYFDWILDYDGIDYRVRQKITVYDDELAGFLFSKAVTTGDTTKAAEYAELFKNELLKSYNKAYIKLLRNRPEEALRIYQERKRAHWNPAFRAEGCKQFTMSFVTFGHKEDKYLNCLVDGFINSPRFDESDHEELGMYLEEHGIQLQALKIYRAGINHFESSLRDTSFPNLRKIYREKIGILRARIAELDSINLTDE